MIINTLYFLALVLFSSSTLQVGRVRTVIAEGVKEVWLSSEDTGAYGNLFLFEIFSAPISKEVFVMYICCVTRNLCSIFPPLLTCKLINCDAL